LGNMGVISEREYGVSSKGYRVSPRRDDRLPAVNPYLMSPAGLQSEFYQGGAVKTLKVPCSVSRQDHRQEKCA